MADRKKIRSKVVSLIRITLFLLGVSLIAVYWYVSYLDPGARHTALMWLTVVVFLGCMCSALIGLNLIYFSTKIKAAKPKLAETIPKLFAMTSVLLMFSALVMNYHFSLALVSGYILAALVAFSAINVFIYLKPARRL